MYYGKVLPSRYFQLTVCPSNSSFFYSGKFFYMVFQFVLSHKKPMKAFISDLFFLLLLLRILFGLKKWILKETHYTFSNNARKMRALQNTLFTNSKR